MFLKVFEEIGWISLIASLYHELRQECKKTNTICIRLAQFQIPRFHEAHMRNLSNGTQSGGESQKTCGNLADS